jgi:sialate O-acetylesterase
MAVTIDKGNPDNVHPADKQTVGHRLALDARAIAYGEQIEYSGPLFRQATPENDAMRVYFTHAKELSAQGGDVQGFEVAGADRKWVPATATIEGSTVLAKAAGVQHPVYVRYAWANVPEANLLNDASLPASPFTSDSRYLGR